MLQVSFTRNILKEAQELVYLGTHCNSDVHKQVIRQLNSGHLRRRSKSIEHILNYHVREHTVTRKKKGTYCSNALHIPYPLSMFEKLDQTNWTTIPRTRAKETIVRKW